MEQNQLSNTCTTAEARELSTATNRIAQEIAQLAASRNADVTDPAQPL
jgi:hypothetical protein